MIFKIITQKDDYLEETYKNAMKSMEVFYGIKWEKNQPRLVVVDDRATINFLKEKTTEDWVIGWSEGRTIYVLNRDHFDRESNHKFNADKYSSLIKHELSHSYYGVISGGKHNPIWLNEGVAIYVSNQDKLKKKPVEFSKFLEFYDHGGDGVYDESGYFIEGLIKKFGKQKLLDFIKEQSKHKTKEEFDHFFLDAFGFNLNYYEINKQGFL